MANTQQNSIEDHIFLLKKTENELRIDENFVTPEKQNEINQISEMDANKTMAKRGRPKKNNEENDEDKMVNTYGGDPSDDKPHVNEKKNGTKGLQSNKQGKTIIPDREKLIQSSLSEQKRKTSKSVVNGTGVNQKDPRKEETKEEAKISGESEIDD